MSYLVRLLLVNPATQAFWRIFSKLWFIVDVIGYEIYIFVNDYPISSTVVTLAVVLYYFSTRPVSRIRDMTAVGFSYIAQVAKSRRRNVVSLVTETINRRNPGNPPPVFPNGWIPLLESDDLKPGESKPITAIGIDFAVFRGTNDKAYVMDAYCPHLGAHLAVGGRVFGNCLECPFHGWKFRGDDGACTDIPYATKIPDFAKIKTWPSVERIGYIFVWYHAENEPPSWEVPEIPEISNGNWTYKGRTEHIVRCHIQEIPENGADIAHLNQIHTAAVLSGNDLKLTQESKFWDFFKHQWEPSWQPDPPPNEHIATMTLASSATWFGFNIPFFKMNLHIKQIGPAMVILRFETMFGSGAFVQCIVPEGPLQQRLIHRMYANVPQIISSFYLIGEATMVERDVMVWNNKAYERTPLLVKEDKLISRHRRWYSQFYSANSPTLEMLRQKSLDW